MAGSVTTNFHEGSRTEYLAQYIFASFGTAIAVPHQEDSGVDIYCTLTEKIGKRSWPQAYFAVQVKSNMDSWIFDSPKSIQWLVEYPLPLFLCVIDKKKAHVRIYHTSPRFYVWATPPLPDRIELTPTGDAKGFCTHWSADNNFSLSPVIDVSLQELLQDKVHKKIRTVLTYWIGIDSANLQRLKMGIHEFQMPYTYSANEEGGGGMVFQGTNRPPSLEIVRDNVKALASYYAFQARESDFNGAVRCAMLLRQLFKDDDSGKTHDLQLLDEITQKVVNGPSTYWYMGVDILNDAIDKMLASEKKNSQPQKPRQSRKQERSVSTKKRSNRSI